MKGSLPISSGLLFLQSLLLLAVPSGVQWKARASFTVGPPTTETCSKDIPDSKWNECGSYTLPLDHFDASNNATVNVVTSTYAPMGYTAAVQQAFLILGQGCVFSNPNYTEQATNMMTKMPGGSSVTFTFLDPRGSGVSSPLTCPDDPSNANFIPSSECASWAKNNSIADYYNLAQMAADLQSILPNFKPGGTASSSISLYILAGDFIGEMWLQAWVKMYSPTPTSIPGLKYVFRNTPADLGSYDFWRSMVTNPDSTVREALDQCTSDVDCMRAFGGVSDMNQLLTSMMISAREEKLQCNDLLSAAWDETTLGPKPYPFFRFYSEILSMLVAHPSDPMDSQWQSGNYATMVPTVVFRISRCNPSDVKNIIVLYKQLKAMTGKRNPLGNACVPSNVLLHNLYFNDLAQGPPRGLVPLLNSGNRQRVVPTPAFFSNLYEAYYEWPKRAPNTTMKTAPFSPAVNPRYLLAGLNPMSNFGQQFAGLGGMEINQGTYTLYQPAAVNALFSSGSVSGDGYGCPFYKIWDTASNNGTTFIWCQQPSSRTKLHWFTDTELNSKLFPLNSTNILDLAGGVANCSNCAVPVPTTAGADALDYQTTTPLPPGQTWATPLPPGQTLPPESYSSSGDDHGGGRGRKDIIDDITGTEVRVSGVGLVVGLIFAAIVFGLIILCAYKCLKRRILNDPDKRDFLKSVYGDQAGNIQNQPPQNRNIYKSI